MFLIRPIIVLAISLAFSVDEPIRADSSDAKQPVLTDFFGDPLPPGAVARLGTVRFRHRGHIDSLVYSPDGKMLASAGSDGVIKFWDPITGKELARLKGHTGGVSSLAFRPDGKMLASGSFDQTIKLWDLRQWHDKATTSPILSLTDHKERVLGVAFSPDGKLLASASYDATIKLWDLSNWRSGDANPPVSTINGHGDGALAVAFSPDGKTLASGGYDNKAKLWDLSSRQLKATFPHDLHCMSIAFRPDGKMLASVSMDGHIKLWDLSQRIASGANKPYVTISAHSHGAGDCSLAFSPDGKTLVSGSWDSTVKLWDLNSLKEGAAITPAHALGGPYSSLNTIHSVAFSPDGKIVAAGGRDQVVKLWDVKTGRPKLIPKADSQTRNGPAKEVEQGHSCMVDGLAFSPVSLTIATGGSTEFNIKVWRLSEPTRNGALALDECVTRKTERVFCQTFSSDGKLLASAGWGGQIQIWDMPGVTKRIALKAKARAFSSLAFSPDSKTLASTCDSEEGATLLSPMLLWDLKTGKEKTNFKGSRQTSVVAFNPEGTRIAIGCAKGTVKLWDVVKERELASLTHGDRSIHCLSFSLAGKTLATDHEDIMLWDVLASKPIGPLRGGLGHGLSYIALSPDGKTLASAGDEDEVVKLWDLTKCRNGVLSKRALGKLSISRNLVGHFDFITGIAFSPDGRFLATSSKDTTVLLWDVAKLRSVQDKEATLLRSDEITSSWNDLAGDNAAKAYEAIWTLESAPGQTVPFMKDRLRPAPVPDEKRMAQLIVDLDNNDFTVRRQALEELEKMHNQAEPFLRRQLTKNLSLEASRRAQQLLQKIDGPVSDPEQLRSLRAIQVLEYIGSAEARAALQTLATGAPEAKLTQEAKASLGRLDKWPKKPAGTN